MDQPRSAPIQVIPFSYENLLSILPEPSIPIESCSICSQIPAYVDCLVRSGELQHNDIPPIVKQLRPFLRLGEHVNTNWIEICPMCRRLYYVEHTYEYLVYGSEDYDAYIRKTPAELIKLSEISWAAAVQSEIHQFANGEWAIIKETKKESSIKSL